MAVEDDAVPTEPAEEGDAGRELVDDDYVERRELAEWGPRGTAGEGCVNGGVEEGEEGTEDGEGREGVEVGGEEEGDGEVELAEDRADHRKVAKDGGREDGRAEDVDLESS